MADLPRAARGVFTLVRAERSTAQTPRSPQTGVTLQVDMGERRTPGPGSIAGTSDGSKETIYGVPVSAVQHCCGRGCKHCRIYWHRMKS